MIKPEKVTGVESPKDIERIDNLFAILFQASQDKEHTKLTFTGAGVWPTVDLIPERGLIICENTTDVAVRLYTKLAGTLVYFIGTIV